MGPLDEDSCGGGHGVEVDGRADDDGVSLFDVLIVRLRIVLQPANLRPGAQSNATLAPGVVQISEFDEFPLMTALLENASSSWFTSPGHHAGARVTPFAWKPSDETFLLSSST